MENDLIQKVLSKTLEANMTPAKIRAYADMIRALKGIAPSPEPNAVKEAINDELGTLGKSDLFEIKEFPFYKPY